MTKQKKSPAFQFYPSDFLSDLNVAVMSTEEVGAYWLLISHCWIQGSLPNDEKELAKVCRMRIDRFRKAWTSRLARCFVEQEVDLRTQNSERKLNLLTHPRLEYERRKQSDWKAKSAMGGQKSAISRKGGSVLVEPNANQKPEMVEPKVNSSSLSSSSSLSPDKDKITDKSTVHVYDFEHLWSCYPNRQGKKNALRHFLATVKNQDDLNRIRSALGNYLKSGNVTRGFVKNGSTWFNEWQDWVSPTETMMKGNTGENNSGRSGKANATTGVKPESGKYDNVVH